MGWFRKVLGVRETPPSRVNGDGQGVTYGQKRGNSFDPELIDGLKADHRELLGMYAEVANQLKEARYTEIVPALMEFKTHLEAHVLTENYRFYGYLEEQLSYDSENTALMRDFRREMGTIARRVVQFVKTWQQRGVDANTAEAFQQDLKKVGALLQQRIAREEHSLYPMYTPPL